MCAVNNFPTSKKWFKPEQVNLNYNVQMKLLKSGKRGEGKIICFFTEHIDPLHY